MIREQLTAKCFVTQCESRATFVVTCKAFGNQPVAYCTFHSRDKHFKKLKRLLLREIKGKRD